MLMGACAVLPTRMSTSFSVRSTTWAKAPLQGTQDGAVTQCEPSTLIRQQRVTALKFVLLSLMMLARAARTGRTYCLPKQYATSRLACSVLACLITVWA